MFVHVQSTAIHVLKVEQEQKTNTTLFKATGVFLNFAGEPINVHVQVYVPKEDSNWHATTSFSPDDIIEVSGTLTNLFKNTLSVRPYYLLLTYIKIFLIDYVSYLASHNVLLIKHIQLTLYFISL
jgi:hypothetical protein